MCGTGALAALVMAVILNIIALDSPQQRFIRLSQTSLIRWRDSVQAETTRQCSHSLHHLCKGTRSDRTQGQAFHPTA